VQTGHFSGQVEPVGWYRDYRQRSALRRRDYLFLLGFVALLVFVYWCDSQFGLIGGIIGAFVGSFVGMFAVLFVIWAIGRRKAERTKS
jgi:apolipoprotein N-acyltransferase